MMVNVILQEISVVILNGSREKQIFRIQFITVREKDEY